MTRQSRSMVKMPAFQLKPVETSSSGALTGNVESQAAPTMGPTINIARIAAPSALQRFTKLTTQSALGAALSQSRFVTVTESAMTRFGHTTLT